MAGTSNSLRPFSGVFHVRLWLSTLASPVNKLSPARRLLHRRQKLSRFFQNPVNQLAAVIGKLAINSAATAAFHFWLPRGLRQS